MKVVTVHRGSRDAYQVARALQEADLLEALVTDLYWPAERFWARGIERFTPPRVGRTLRCRHADNLPADSVSSCLTSGAASMFAENLRSIPFHWRSNAVRWCDRSLGKRAAQIATRRKAALLSYSYYGHSAFSNYHQSNPRILFQLHPHPAVVREILGRERMLHPECASSLDKEWELALPEEDFRRLTEEASMAQHWLVASNFTKQTLAQAGVPSDKIVVVPYGVESQRFTPRDMARSEQQPLRLLFVGTLGQRKGLKYLIQALNFLNAGSVELTVCGRPVDDLSWLPEASFPISILRSVGAERLLEEYRAADVFVFPSLAEGFGQVLLEAMASGLPIISTTSTAAPDLIRHGTEGFIIAPGNAGELAQHIEKFLANRQLVSSMGGAARRRAEYFTWERFRAGVGAHVANMLESTSDRLSESCFCS
jgi:glycosyltransferase involved in cell wall biosynthesis